MNRRMKENLTSHDTIDTSSSSETVSKLKAKVLSLESLLVLSDQRNEL